MNILGKKCNKNNKGDEVHTKVHRKRYLATRYMTETRISSPNPRCLPLAFPFLVFLGGGSLNALKSRTHDIGYV